MWINSRKQTGFTIVELLIVIVVIGILAAITIVAYNGVQSRARQSAIKSDLTNNSKRVMVGAVNNGQPPSTIEVVSAGDTKIAVSQGLYNIVSYCSTDTGFVMAAESKSGDKFYTKNNTAVTQDNTINVYDPCVSLSVQNTNGSAANKTYIGMASTSCAGENAVCNFSGSATIAYGSAAMGRFTAKANMSSPVTCSNAIFGDPASGYGKACYIVSY